MFPRLERGRSIEQFLLDSTDVPGLFGTNVAGRREADHPATRHTRNAFVHVERHWAEWPADPPTVSQSSCLPLPGTKSSRRPISNQCRANSAEAGPGHVVEVDGLVVGAALLSRVMGESEPHVVALAHVVYLSQHFPG